MTGGSSTTQQSHLFQFSAKSVPRGAAPGEGPGGVCFPCLRVPSCLSPLRSVWAGSAGPSPSAGGTRSGSGHCRGASLIAAFLLFSGVFISMKSPRRFRKSHFPQQLLCTFLGCAQAETLVCVTWFFLGALGMQFRLEGSGQGTWILRARVTCPFDQSSAHPSRQWTVRGAKWQLRAREGLLQGDGTTFFSIDV